LYKPSYISLNTVLFQEGVIFQYDSSIFLVSYLSRELTVKNQTFIYKKIKDDILLNPRGLIRKDFYHQASLSRAFLDMIYLYTDFHFDNLFKLNWDECFELAAIYENKSLVKRLNSYYQDFKEDAQAHRINLLEQIDKAIKHVEEFPNKDILQGLGELLLQNHKDWVKDNLKNELLLKLKIHREAIKIQ
ncbi:MAG: hypothetical protein LW817_08575, partial [Candidatus Caenarcaniphilales bacterium]|nr:hypothetical protein [Candidatus Caenarcaniphilales bacterium]